jgi:hypothetical protein
MNENIFNNFLLSIEYAKTLKELDAISTKIGESTANLMETERYLLADALVDRRLELQK